MSHVGEKCNHSRVVIESSLDFTKGETCDEKYSSIQMEERVLLKRVRSEYFRILVRRKQEENKGRKERNESGEKQTHLDTSQDVELSSPTSLFSDLYLVSDRPAWLP